MTTVQHEILREFVDVERLVDWIGSARPAVEGKPILLPGGNGELIRAERLKTGIPIGRPTYDKPAATARQRNVSPPLFAAEA